MTRASGKPVRRIVQSMHDGEIIVEIRDDTLSLRPLGSRLDGKRQHSITWGRLYDRLVEAAILEQRQAKRRARRST